VVACAAEYARAHEMRDAVPRLRGLLDHPSELVRDGALGALEVLLEIDQLPAAVEPLLWDEFGPIRARVDRLLERLIDHVEYVRAQGAVEEVARL
jgi:hypothetical protein